MKAHSLILAFAALIGCSPAPSGSPGGSGGATSTTTTTSTETASGGAGGAGGMTETTTTTETGCVPGAEACVDTPSYPDPLLAYDPAQNVVDAVWPAGDETPHGAATGLLGPWPTNRTIVAVSFVVEEVPSAITVSVQLETACGVPPQSHDPNTSTIFVDGSKIMSEPFGALGSLLITVPLPFGLVVPAWTAVYASRILTEPSAHVDAIAPAGKSALRSYWWGEVDNDCDGKKDAALGWAALAHPTAPGITPYDYDLGIGVVAE